MLPAFADHDALVGHFDLPWALESGIRWPMTAKIPWNCVDLAGWTSEPATRPPDFASPVDPTTWYQSFGRAYEKSFEGHLAAPASNQLPTGCLGRGQFLKAQPFTPHPPSIRASRHGEEAMAPGFVNQQVVRWFRQLRRLQALVQNCRAASPAPTAAEFRLQTWHSVLRARGFQGSFASWWLVRPHRLQGVIDHIPQCLPSLAILEDIYQDYRVNYRAFESWNLRNRQAVLQVAIQENTRMAFQRVVGKPTVSMDFLTHRQTATIMSVAPGNFEVTTDSDVLVPTDCICKLDDVPAVVTRTGSARYHIESDLLLCPGQELCVIQHYTSTAEKLSAVMDFWQKRWQRHANVPPEQWARIVQFTAAHLTSLPFCLGPLTLSEWDRAVTRFAPRAARGPDSFDRLDLVRMPQPFRLALIDLLNRVEAGLPWPQQLCLGLGHCLPKTPMASAVGDFRPIIIFSQVYRAWASCRSTAMLATLAECAGPRMKGFLASREAGDVWFMLQSLIESTLGGEGALHGCSADLEKAFESIPRAPLRTLALALGLPAFLVNAWFSFLQHCERRFQLNGQVSDSVRSLSGFPEGCGLSVLGMSLLDFCWDRYQLIFAPAAVSMSYVDNYCLLAESIGGLMRAYAAMDTFVSLWSMKLDSRKTYFWSTDAASRASLRRLGFEVKLTASELGGALSFGLRSSGPIQQKRVAGLDPVFKALHRLAAPGHLKEYILRQALWPRAFHAACICPFAWSSIVSLRTKATRALGHGRAGAHPGIRLTFLTSDPTTDPGCFHLLRALLDFRRLISKQRALVDLWRSHFYSDSVGSAFGPFRKIAELCHRIEWTLIDPPWLLDHDGLRWHLLDVPSQLLKDRIMQGWFQAVAREVGHRQDYAGLQGITWPPPKIKVDLSPLDVARVASLREGAFLTRQHQGKFDLSKGTRCPYCGGLDTLEHRAITCPYFASARSKHPRALRCWTGADVALRERLMPSRLPSEAALLRAFNELPDSGRSFQVGMSDCSDGHYHLFTDGSCLHGRDAPFHLAAWSVVSATHGCPLASGPLPGLQQTSPRSELYAFLVALRWRDGAEVICTIWSDSAYVTAGIDALLHGLPEASYDSNEDLWQEVASLVKNAPPGVLHVQHVSGHSFLGYTQDCDDWAAYWNDQADKLALRAQSCRPDSFERCWQHFHFEWRNLTQLLSDFQGLHLELARAGASLVPQLIEVETDDEPEPDQLREPVHELIPISDSLPIQWRQLWSSEGLTEIFGQEFVFRWVDFLSEQAEEAVCAFSISFLELAALAYVQDFPHPLPGTSSRGHVWIDRSGVSFARDCSVSVAQRVRYMSRLMRCLDRVLGLQIEFCEPLNRVALGITFPLPGLCLHLSQASLVQIDSLLRTFTAGRPVRIANDLSRPFSRVMSS